MAPRTKARTDARFLFVLARAIRRLMSSRLPMNQMLASQKFLFHGRRVVKWSLTTRTCVCVWVFCHGSAAASILPKFTPNPMKLQRKIGNRAVGWVQQLSPGCWLCVSDGLVLIAGPIAANCFLIQNVKPTRKTGRISRQGYAIPPILVGKSYKKINWSKQQHSISKDFKLKSSRCHYHYHRSHFYLQKIGEKFISSG